MPKMFVYVGQYVKKSYDGASVSTTESLQMIPVHNNPSLLSLPRLNRKKCYNEPGPLPKKITTKVKSEKDEYSDDDTPDDHLDDAEMQVEQIEEMPLDDTQADTHVEKIFLNAETKTTRQRDSLSAFFHSIECQTRSLPLHLQLLAKRKISDIIFDLEEAHISEQNGQQ